MKKYYVYILTNKSETLYIGMTDDLQRRVYEHKNKLIDGFTKKYKINILIYFEEYKNPLETIEREKQLKNWSRKKKLMLISKVNPKFKEIDVFS